jgi:hypothetical protein
MSVAFPTLRRPFAAARSIAFVGPLLAGLAGVLPNAARAGDAPFAPGSSASVSVGGLGVSLGLLELRGPGDWSARVLLHSGSLSTGERDNVGLEGNRYDLRQRLGAGLSVLGDYRPWPDSGWRLTTGVVVSRLKTDLTGRADSTGNLNLNGHSYSTAQVGTLTGKLRYQPVNLYLGGGWESKTPGTPGWRFVGDLGLLLMAKPSATLHASAAAGNTALQQDLAAEARELRRPGLGVVGSIGVAYGF